jgi:hypothetical protein
LGAAAAVLPPAPALAVFFSRAADSAAPFFLAVDAMVLSRKGGS